MRSGERGSALIIAVLVMVILTLLGISFLLLAETENRIAENERLSSQALYFAEAGTRAVVQWFNHPGAAGNLLNPPIAAVDRSKRSIDEDGDPTTVSHPQDGAAWPRYKQDIDVNTDGLDDLFDRPYRVELRDTFLGTEDGPDLRIDGEAAGAGRDFLEDLSDALMAGYPAAEGGIHARIHRIDVYAPPYLKIGADWTRYGVATVKVVGRIVRTRDGGDELLAERVVKAVVNEIPYATPFGAAHSCGSLTTAGPSSMHWGAVTAVGDVHLDTDLHRTPASLPRVLPAGSRLDLLWAYDDPASFDAYRSAINGMHVEDPWLHVLAGGALTPAPAHLAQPYPFSWTGALVDGAYPSHDNPEDGSHSNLFQEMPLVGCPDFDYDLWKTVATSGQEGVEYWVWRHGSVFQRDGVGPERTFREITDVDPSNPAQRPAIFFFDTADGQPPHDDDTDGRFDNLTPAIEVPGGTWSPRGVVYLNAESLRTPGVVGRPAEIRAPGEPFQDHDQNGIWATGENWINLRYPTDVTGAFRADRLDVLQDAGAGTTPMRNARGPLVTAEVSFFGILHTSGSFDTSGPSTGAYFGSVIAREGITQSNTVAPATQIYWNDGIRTGEWPPVDWALPRVVVTRWETDL